MVNEDINKKNQRKYLKYEREHSNSLWHMAYEEKVKLNNKKIKYIIKQKEKGESSKKLAIIYGVTVGYINKIYFSYLEYGKDELYKTGRKNKEYRPQYREINNKHKE